MPRSVSVLFAALLLACAATAAESPDETVKAVNNADVEWIFTRSGPIASLKQEIFSASTKVKDTKGVTKALLAALNDDTKWQGAHVVLYIVTGTPRDPNVNSFGPLRVDFDKKGVAKINLEDKKAVREFWTKELKR